MLKWLLSVPSAYRWLVLGLLLGALLSWGWPTTPPVLLVTLINQTSQTVSSITLDFGNPDSQSHLLILRLAPGEQRQIGLNHQPGMGFNVLARYADGQEQNFCANRGLEGWRQQVVLSR